MSGESLAPGAPRTWSSAPPATAPRRASAVLPKSRPPGAGARGAAGLHLPVRHSSPRCCSAALRRSRPASPSPPGLPPSRRSRRPAASMRGSSGPTTCWLAVASSPASSARSSPVPHRPREVAVALGLGLNLTVNAFPGDVAGTSLHMLAAHPPSAETLLIAWLDGVADRMATLERDGLAPIIDEWRRSAVGLGGPGDGPRSGGQFRGDRRGRRRRRCSARAIRRRAAPGPRRRRASGLRCERLTSPQRCSPRG